MLRAKEFPSTSHGHEISASKYALSQAIHITIRKTYGRIPLKCLLLRRNTPNISDICNALAKTANNPPPTVALHTQNVVNAFQRTNAE